MKITHITSKSPRFPNVSFWSVFELVPHGTWWLIPVNEWVIHTSRESRVTGSSSYNWGEPPSTVTVVHHEVSFDLNLSFNSFPFRSLLDAALDLSTLRCSPLTRSFSTACLRRLLWKPQFVASAGSGELATNEAAASCVKVYDGICSKQDVHLWPRDHVCHTAFQGLHHPLSSFEIIFMMYPLSSNLHGQFRGFPTTDLLHCPIWQLVHMVHVSAPFNITPQRDITRG